MASFNTKQADWYGAHQACALDTAVGDIFYVSEGGADANDGLTPLTPRLTITAAHALCTAGDNDYIIVLDYNIRHDGEGWPINLNKSDVHLIGSLHTGILAPSHFVVGTGADTIRIGADRIEIAGLSLGAVDDTHSCIVTDGGYYAQLHVHHCDLGHTTTCQDGIVVAANQSWNWEIDHCRFGQDTVGIIRDAIRHIEQVGRIHIHDNVFYVRAPGHGIQLGLILGSIIERNTFKVPDNATGDAINIGGAHATGGGLINNNWAANDVSNITNNPYRDVGAIQNHWGLNYAGLVPTYPICV